VLRRRRQLLVQAQQDPCPERVTVSFDEKTGMQAKERIAPDQPVRPGQPARLEFEYARHGTLVLFAMMLVHSGEILARTRPNRTNPVTAAVMVSLFQELLATGYQNIDIVLDQLNTHWSIDSVKAVAELCGLPEPDPRLSARALNERPGWRIRTNPSFFTSRPSTPAGSTPLRSGSASWPASCCAEGSFGSTADLEDKVHRFVEYFNKKLARPYKLKEWRLAA
jgi:hypothetical protein